MSPSDGLVGLMSTSLTTGAVFDTVTAFDHTAAPSSTPSVGVTAQRTSWSRANQSSLSVSRVTPGSAPSTVQP